jgi:hypothetical protein
VEQRPPAREPLSGAQQFLPATPLAESLEELLVTLFGCLRVDEEAEQQNFRALRGARAAERQIPLDSQDPIGAEAVRPPLALQAHRPWAENELPAES